MLYLIEKSKPQSLELIFLIKLLCLNLIFIGRLISDIYNKLLR
jgi:hypothetical protein